MTVDLLPPLLFVHILRHFPPVLFQRLEGARDLPELGLVVSAGLLGPPLHGFGGPAGCPLLLTTAYRCPW